jgi:OmpA-OmpF porin, OOP family
MRKFTILFFVTLITISVFGQTKEKPLAIGIGPGYYFNLGDDGKGGFTIPNFFFSGYLSRTFDLRGKMDVGLKQSNEKNVNYFQAGLDLRLKLYNGKTKLEPYLYAGPGYFRDNPGMMGTKEYKGGINFNGGVGTKLRLSESVALYLEAGYIYGVNGQRKVDGVQQKVRDDFFKLSSIFEFDFADNDDDNDGVKNKIDKCRKNTPLEISKGVDVNGCPVDLDFDGVPEYRDDCPNTPKGCKVDDRGCPIDTDKDGIMDCADDCPTAPGLEKFKGCPDTDNDGVPDPKDQCPNTPKGCKVDTKGCPLDTDNDGIIDCEDQCPEVPGVKELKGCPIICNDFEVSPVFFDFDKATLRPEGMAALDAFINQLGKCKDYEIVVDGYTCNIGTKKYNLGLSDERAQEVVKYLLSKGLNNAFIGSKGYGEENPALPNSNKGNREKNRRAVIELTVK